VGSTSTDANGNAVITFNCGTSTTNAVFRTVPAGTVMAFAGEKANIPAGWLLCDGREVSRTQYQDLFLAIGIANGAGNTATTFHLPDYRGRFLRGVDDGAGRDPDKGGRTAPAVSGGVPSGYTGDNVGSVQGDALKIHGHGNTRGNNEFLYTSGGPGSEITPGGTGMQRTSIAPTGDSTESRPKNINVFWIIKH
jgi:microcystin-dependent protein